MSEHTKGPWYVFPLHPDRFSIGAYRRGSLSIKVGEAVPCRVVTGSGDESILEEEAAANVRRIVACVNACAWMTEPEAEVASLRKDSDYLMASEMLRARVLAQRDELLAALRELVELKNLKGRSTDAESASESDYAAHEYQRRKPDAWNAACAAIAKAEAES